MFEHVHPPRVLWTRRHMIGDYVQEQPHAGTLQFADQGLKLPVRAEFGIQRERIGHIIAMSAAMPGLQQRGSVEVRYAQAVEIRHKLSSLSEAEAWTELHPVCGGRYSQVGHLLDANLQLIAQSPELLSPAPGGFVAPFSPGTQVRV